MIAAGLEATIDLHIRSAARLKMRKPNPSRRARRRDYAHLAEAAAFLKIHPGRFSGQAPAHSRR
jgi:hypothetical protein